MARSRSPKSKTAVEIALSSRSESTLAMIQRTGSHAGVHGKFGKGRGKTDGRSRASVKSNLRRGEY